MNALVHTPAHTISVPDYYYEEGTHLTYSAEQDLDAQDPRKDYAPEHAALWAYSEPPFHRSVASEPCDDNPGLKAFRQVYTEFGDAELALRVMRKYLRVYYPDRIFDTAISTIRGYGQSDWLDVVAVVDRNYGNAENFIELFRMWAFGDVWTVDGSEGPISGIYADGPDEAVEYYRDFIEKRENISEDKPTV